MGVERVERRITPRLKVFSGRAEFKRVRGRGRQPPEPARILDWSRGGLQLKVYSPRRRMLFLKLEPCLYEGDQVTCLLRLPPRYRPLKIVAQVTRVEDAGSGHLRVGLAFDDELSPEHPKQAIARLLEPRERTRWSGRVARSDNATLANAQ
jgi:hypothetical protein